MSNYLIFFSRFPQLPAVIARLMSNCLGLVVVKQTEQKNMIHAK